MGSPADRDLGCAGVESEIEGRPIEPFGRPDHGLVTVDWLEVQGVEAGQFLNWGVGRIRSSGLIKVPVRAGEWLEPAP